MIERVAIVGTGLIGASFGLALKSAGFTGTITGVSSARSVRAAKERGAIDSESSLEGAASCDLIFLSQPISGIIETLGKLTPMVGANTLVTDAGSTKTAIVNAAASLPVFVGGHPMAGKEARGAEAAEPELFRGRPWVLTSKGAHPVEIEFRSWLEKIGARTQIVDAKTHDRLVAWSSHLPQLASTALAAALHDGQPEAIKVAGPGLIDMTRLALSSYDLWQDILNTNQSEVAAALDAYIAKLIALRADFATEFGKGADFAKSLRSR